jgi:hypothetical protein
MKLNEIFIRKFNLTKTAWNEHGQVFLGPKKVKFCQTLQKKKVNEKGWSRVHLMTGYVFTFENCTLIISIFFSFLSKISNYFYFLTSSRGDTFSPHTCHSNLLKWEILRKSIFTKFVFFRSLGQIFYLFASVLTLPDLTWF